MTHLKTAKVTIGLWIALGLAGCATALKPGAQKVSVSDSTDMTIRNCQRVGVVEGFSLFDGGLLKKFGRDKARAEAINAASDLQANFIVWKDVDPVGIGTLVQANAFNCRVD